MTDIKLNAVNILLNAIGEAPVNTLSAPNVDVFDAIRIIDYETRIFLARGWSFNTLEHFQLNPEVPSGKIKWADNYISIKGVDGNKYTNQGGYVYDATHNTNVFTTAITVNIVYITELQDLPVLAQVYIIAKAAVQFHASHFGDAEMAQTLRINEAEAWANLQEFDMDYNQYNVLENPYVASIFTRR